MCLVCSLVLVKIISSLLLMVVFGSFVFLFSLMCCVRMVSVGCGLCRVVSSGRLLLFVVEWKCIWCSR